MLWHFRPTPLRAPPQSLIPASARAAPYIWNAAPQLRPLTPPHASGLNAEAIPFGEPTVSPLTCLRRSEHNLHPLIITCQEDHQSTLPFLASISSWKELSEFSARTGGKAGVPAWDEPHGQSPFFTEDPGIGSRLQTTALWAKLKG